MESNLQLFLDALRSGEFTQAHKALREGDSYCCLGVACEVYRRHTGKGEWENPQGLVWKFNLPDNSCQTAFMPVDVYKWFGLPDPNPILEHEAPDGGTCESATDLNDILRWDFKQIADAFEHAFAGKKEVKDDIPF